MPGLLPCDANHPRGASRSATTSRGAPRWATTSRGAPRYAILLLPALLALPACDSGGALGALSSIPVAQTVPSCVDGPVDIFRDEYGIPHIYGHSIADVSCAQGYVMGQDRILQMDLFRRLASGTLAELLGGLDASLIDSDISMRTQRMRDTATTVWQGLQASADPTDQGLVLALNRFAAGVNQAIGEFKSGQRKLPSAYVLAWDPKSAPAWSPIDSLTIARLQAFELSYDAQSEIARTQVQNAALQVFDKATDPTNKTRAGMWADLYRQTPMQPAFILPDATACGTQQAQGGPPPDALPPPILERPFHDSSGLRNALVLVGLNKLKDSSRGSNNWTVGPAHTKNGYPIVSNDTHLSLSNPPIFYLQHLVAGPGLEEMGVQFPGLPGIVLGMNRHLAWGGTVTYADVTDVYAETILYCAGQPCVSFTPPGGTLTSVPLTSRVEMINVGALGKISSTVAVTLWTVPHHGPILPTINPDHTVAPLGSQELSVRYTGYQPTQELRAVFGLSQAASVSAGMAALEKDFSVGGQNWNMADSQGHIGWTSHVVLPVRPAGTQPSLVLPADGSAEWLPDGVPAAQQPRAVDPSCGYVVTANNDPLGATGGKQVPIYHGWDYDPGVRAGRITTRIKNVLAAQGKLSVATMQDIQADHVSFLGTQLTPVLLDGGAALLAARTDPTHYADLAEVAMGLDAATVAAVQDAVSRLKAWTFTTPSGLDTEASAAQMAEAVATSLFHTWLTAFTHRALDDELAVMAPYTKGWSPDQDYLRRLLLAAALTPGQLHVKLESGGDSLIFDDLRTPSRVETRREISALALLDGLKALQGAVGAAPGGWAWGKLHRLTLEPLVPIASLALPSPTDPMYAKGYPRHGDLYSVDVAGFAIGSNPPQPLQDYNYADGPAIRFVAEMWPSGPVAYNVLPGGEVFNPDSPHYADQWAMWRVNQAMPLAFETSDVAASVKKELASDTRAHVQLVKGP